jgi:type I restriction-modification system DNA methylase subunit
MELTKEKAKENLKVLIAKFESELNLSKIWDYNEEATKTAFIQPFLKDVLGWNVNDRDEVSPEERVSRNRVDYGLKIDGKTKIFVEAKPPKADLEKHIEQAVKYGYNRKTVPFVLLTDFEGLKLFDVTVKPDLRNFRKGLKIDLVWDKYLENFDDIWLLRKESAQSGEIDKIIKVKPKDRLPVDKAILEDLKKWREILAKDIYKNNPHLFESGDREKDAQYLKEITQRLLDRLIFMRFCEDRKFVHRTYLKPLFEDRSEAMGTSTMVLLQDEFKHYNIIFDSDLFRPQEWEKGLLFDFKVMYEIIMDTYNPYQFDVIPLEVLGNIYEQYLGYAIRLTEQQVKYELKTDVRKAGGVYYTPEYIVDYIVKNTVGKLLQELPASKIKKLRILDPACGSGSFLIRAYEEMLNWYKNQKKKQQPRRHSDLEHSEGEESQQLFEHEGQEHILSIEEKAQILREHIFGVDIDEQAVEVTKLSLMLKMLEGEFGIIPGSHILPMLDKNIKCGNSLISGDTFELMKYFGKNYYKVKPFEWKEQFRKIIVDEGGFDVVVGNPPWVDIKGLDTNLVNYCFSEYSTTNNRMNIFAVFVERSLQVLKKRGYFGYIIPNSILPQSSYKKLRLKILESLTVTNIVRLPDNVFENVKAETVILVLYKGKKPKRFENEIIIFDHKTKLNSLDYQKAVEVKSVDQNLWNDEKYYSFNLFTSPREISIVQKIESIGSNLYTFCDFSLGITPYDKYKGHTQKQISERVFHVEKKIDKSCKPLLAGGDIGRYYLKWNGIDWLKYGSWLGAQREERFFSQTRILVRQIISGNPPRILATISSDEYCNTQSIFNIIPKQHIKEDVKYLLAIINSKLLNYYHTQCYLDKAKILFQKILIQNAKQFPIRKIDFSNSDEKKLHDDLVALVDVIIDLNKKLHTAKGDEKDQIQRQIEKTDKEIDELVYKLYGITEEERRIIEGT